MIKIPAAMATASKGQQEDAMCPEEHTDPLSAELTAELLWGREGAPVQTGNVAL